MLKLSLALLSAVITFSDAQPHRHAHQHLHKEKRAPSPVADVVALPGPTEVVYLLNDSPIPESEVQQGIKNGTLVFAQDGQLSSAASIAVPQTSALPSATSVSVPLPTSLAASTSIPVSISSSSAPTSSSVAAPTSSSVAAAAPSAPASGSTGLNSPFPDGQLDCSHFPSDYGAVAIDYLGLNGWIGIQHTPDQSAGGFFNIETVTPGGDCKDGSFCSYACPPGYEKTQWPQTQGATGQSVGGLQCKNGKLYLTNSGLSNNLCQPGAQQVTILTHNTLSQTVATCRTDYPGLEAMTIPTTTQPGGYGNLTCPDAANYYHWEGASTSAQYYVNPAGVATSDACQWGTAANPWGNFAPLNLGVGWSNGAAWLSIFQNAPTTTAKLPFSIEIQGDSVSGKCRYSNGQYCSGDNYDQCSETTGCTVSLSSGTATFVFSD